MIVLDANILLYAYDQTSALPARAPTWVQGVFSESTLVGVPCQTIGAFLRIVTNPRLPGERYTTEDAASLVDSWLQQPKVRLLSPGDDQWPVLRQMIIIGQARGPLVTDAQLAALTIEHGGILHTTDRDFARFPGLCWMNPLL